MSYTKDQLIQLTRQYAEKNGIDPDAFQAQIQMESGFNPHAQSNVGAQGLGQLMPATAKHLGVTDPFDVHQNLDAAARYMADHLQQTGGNYALAFAGYNAGMGNVKKYGGIPPFAETQNYVKNIMARTNQLKSQAQGMTSIRSEGGQEPTNVSLGKLSSPSPEKETLSQSPLSQEPEDLKSKVQDILKRTGNESEEKESDSEGESSNDEVMKRIASAPLPKEDVDQYSKPDSQAPPSQFYHLPELIEAQYPGGMQAFMKEPYDHRKQVVDQYSSEYLRNNSVFQAQPKDDRHQYIQDMVHHMLQPDQTDLGMQIQQAGQGFMSGLTGGVSGKPTQPNTIGAQIGEFAGPLVGYGAAALGGGLVGGPLGAIAGAGAYGGLQSGAEYATSHGATAQNPFGSDPTGTLLSGGLGAVGGAALGALGPEASLVQRGLVNAGVGAGTAGIESAYQQQHDTGKINLGQVAQEAGQAGLAQAVMGEALHQAGHLIGKGADIWGRPYPEAQKPTIEQTPIEQEATSSGLPKQGTPEYTDLVNKNATNPAIVKMAKKLNDRWESKQAQVALEGGEPQEVPEDVQHYKDVLAKANELSDEQAKVQAKEGKQTEVTSEEGKTYTKTPEGELIEKPSPVEQSLKGEISKTEVQIPEEENKGVPGPAIEGQYPTADQRVGNFNTLDSLLEDPKALSSFQTLPIESQLNMIKAAESAKNGQRLYLMDYDPKTGQLSSGGQGLFASPESDKYITPLGFSINQDGELKMHGYNNNLMERSYIFKSSPDGYGVGGIASSPEIGHQGELSNAYHNPGKYVPSNHLVDSTLNKLSDEDIRNLGNPSNNLLYNQSKAKIIEHFQGNPDLANHVAQLLTDKRALAEHVGERLGPIAQFLKSDINSPEFGQVRSALAKDPVLSRLTSLIAC